MKKICVFCGSNFGTHSDYLRGAEQLAAVLVRNGLGLVYGGAKVGLMGSLANAVLRLGGEVIGVIPHFLKEKEIAHEGLTDLRIVGSMHERKTVMADLTDAFIALPGGLGTLEEVFEIATWQHLGMHSKPIGLLNVRGFFDKLNGFLDTVIQEGFLRPESRSIFLCDQDPDQLLEHLRNYKPVVVNKWFNQELPKKLT